VGVIGLGMAGPTIMVHGTAKQKQKHLAGILSGDTIFCQGFSEPGSGSDLASVSTRAELDGDSYVVNGQKVWSSWAHVADYCILLTRSDPAERSHRGLTYFVLDMHTPGVEVRPLRQITGDPEFNEIFLSDVRIPVEDVLDAPGNGWAVAMTTLLNERGTLGFALTAHLEHNFLQLLDTVKELGLAGDPLVRDRVAGLYVELEGLRYTNFRSLTKLMKTGIPGPEGSVAKLTWSEANQRLTSVAVDLLGADATLDGAEGFWSGYWQFQQLRSRGNTIEAGTSEVLRNIIAERLVGLPRSR
jgi:alkylation response protein AidB-like acyl-CoA dehydrogenase